MTGSDGIATFRIKYPNRASFWFQAWHHGLNLIVSLFRSTHDHLKESRPPKGSLESAQNILPIPKKRLGNLPADRSAFVLPNETEYTRIRVGERMNNDGNPVRAFFIKNVMLSTDPESMKITPKDPDRHHVYPDGFIRGEIQRMRPF